VIETFAGAEGLVLGLEEAGLRAIVLVENDPDYISTLRLNRPNWNVYEEDIREVDFKGFKADVVSGGFSLSSF
jgi:DNA (cytosine-5)-methyltransferase 1